MMDLTWYILGLAKTDASWSYVRPSASEEYSCNLQLRCALTMAFSSPSLWADRRILHSFVRDLPLRRRKWWIGLSAGTGCTISRTEICEIETTWHRVARWKFAEVSEDSTASSFRLNECPNQNTSYFVLHYRSESFSFLCVQNIGDIFPNRTRDHRREGEALEQMTVDPSLFDGSILCGLYLKI
jgi:hypothetical protein